MTNQTKTKQSNLQVKLKAAAYLTAIGVFACVNTAYADWFQVGNIQNNLITPIYNLVNDNLGFKAQIPADKPKCPVYFISLGV